MTTKTMIIMSLGICLLVWGCDTKTKTVDACGDGFVDPGEECDGSNLAGASCASLGFYDTEGVLACSDACMFLTTDCGVAQCGDGLIQEGFDEQCDGSELGGNSCQQLGYTRGTLACLPSCRFDITGCERDGYCGDGTVNAPFEECEGTNLDGKTCNSIGFYQGTLRCNSECWFDTSACVGNCGDGEIQEVFGEDCDGANLSMQTCESLGYWPGTLSCLSVTCQWDFSACGGRCGDGEVQTLAGEVCDGTVLDGETCATQGFFSGTLECDADCTSFLTTACTNCGNGVIDALEVCDGNALNGQTCESQGRGPGILSCNGECTGFIFTGCSSVTMVQVPAGTFQRDATSTNLSVVSAFRMSKFEITRAQWTAVTGWTDPSNVTYSSGTSDPVQMVSWYDAIAFCNKLSLLEGLTPVYTISGVDFTTLTYAQIPTANNATWNAATANWNANGYRLPTEMEWMWAAMGADLANPGATNTTGYAKAFAGSTGTNAIGDYAVETRSGLTV